MIPRDFHESLYFGGVLFIVLGVVICFLGLLLSFGFLNPDSLNSVIEGGIIVLGLFTLVIGIGMHYIGSTGISEREEKKRQKQL